MKAEILKRIERLERRTTERSKPDLIMIWYEIGEGWKVAETFKEGKRKETALQHYSEYIIPPDYEGAFILELFNSPQESDIEAGLITASGRELQKMFNCKGCGLSLELVSMKNSTTGQFNITVTSYE